MSKSKKHYKKNTQTIEDNTAKTKEFVRENKAVDKSNTKSIFSQISKHQLWNIFLYILAAIVVLIVIGLLINKKETISIIKAILRAIV